MTDLSAGEHIIDALEIELRKMNRIPDLLLQGHAMIYPRPNWPRNIGAVVTGDLPDNTMFLLDKVTLNGVSLSKIGQAELRNVQLKLTPIGEQLAVVTRHPSSERFHSLLPHVAEMAYRLDVELYPAGATTWGFDAWIVPMRQMERTLRCLQAAARGERTAKSPHTLMMEVSALAMVARKYYTDNYSGTWAHDYTSSMGETHDRKQSDYGTDSDPFHNVRASENWSVEPWVGAMIRLSDKVNRLQTFAQKGVLQNESALDSIIDISVYGLIGRVLYETRDAA